MILEISINKDECENQNMIYPLKFEYKFEYMFSTYNVNVYDFSKNTNGYIPHSEILSQCLFKIKKINDKRFYPFETKRGNWYSIGIKKQLQEGKVYELIQKAGFSTNYYVVHNIKDIEKLNFEKIIQNIIKNNSFKQIKMINIFNVLELLQKKDLYMKLEKAYNFHIQNN